MKFVCFSQVFSLVRSGQKLRRKEPISRKNENVLKFYHLLHGLPLFVQVPPFFDRAVCRKSPY